MIVSRIISASLSPNTEQDDVWRAITVLFAPWRWKKGEGVARVRAWLRSYAQTETVVLFNSGRSALLALLHAFSIGAGDEVIIQAFTCVAVPNSIRWAGAIPIYADITPSYNLDPKDIEKKITSKTKAIIVQHTFGMPADMDAIKSISRKRRLLLIEDCAHGLGATYKGKKLGAIGDAAFFSFGRDKVVSSVWGGAAVIRGSYKDEARRLKTYHDSLAMPGYFWILQQLLHPVVFSVILPLYTLGLGKILLVILQKLGLLSYPVYPEEKLGGQPVDFPSRYPNALSLILERQLRKLDRFIAEREAVALYYMHALHHPVPPNDIKPGFLRYPILVAKPDRIMSEAKTAGILLGNWYRDVIAPHGVDMSVAGYTTGSCPAAEKAAMRIINLPTRISLSDARRVLEIVGAHI